MDDPRHPALEAAIALNPYDRDAYLVYADWLEGLGDPRAELIRAQIADGNSLEHGEPVRKLLSEHRAQLLGPLAASPSYAFTLKFGFIHGALIDDEDVACAVRVEELLRHPSGRFLVELFTQSSALPAVIDAIVAAPPQALRVLSLGHDAEHEVALHGLEAMLRGLDQLMLRGRFALDALDLPKLTTAWMSTIGLASSSVSAIATAAWPRIERLYLDLSGTLAGVDDLAPLFHRTDLSALARLELMFVPFYDELCALLPGAPFAKQLRELMLMGGLTDDGALALASGARAFARLEHLAIDGHRLTGRGCKAIEAMGVPKLSGLYSSSSAPVRLS